MTTKLAEERARAEARKRKLSSELDRIAAILATLEDVELVILFGSQAGGRTSVSSDLDLIVVRRDRRPFLERLDALYRLLVPSVALDLLVYTPEELERLVEERSFVAAAVREGKLLLDRRAGVIP